MFGKRKTHKPKAGGAYSCHGKWYDTMQDATEGKCRMQYEMASNDMPIRDFRTWQCIEGHFHLEEVE